MNIEHSGCLPLSNGNTWEIAAGNEAAFRVVSQFIKAMQLQTPCEPDFRIIVSVDSDWSACSHSRVSFAYSDSSDSVCGNCERSSSILQIVSSLRIGDTINCVLKPDDSNYMISVVQSIWLSMIIGLHAETLGGLLLHGALAERDGVGVILAGHSNAGKTTASERFPAPWRSLCDDMTLVVRDRQGLYWAHPLPTWSNFMPDRLGGSWKVRQAVPLKGIFFLQQAECDLAEPVDAAQAAALLIGSAGQASFGVSRYMDRDEIRLLRLRRFDTVCELVQIVPSHYLHLSLTGAFWHEIERVLFKDHKDKA